MDPSAFPTEENPFLTISEDLSPLPPLPISTTITLPFSSLLCPPLRLNTNVGECGGQLWPAGMVLAEYLIRHQLEEMKGKTILELGTGSGLVGLAVAVALEQRPLPTMTTKSAAEAPPPLPKTSTIHLTDGMPSLIPLIDANIKLNNLSSSPTASTCLHASLLPWGGLVSPPLRADEKPDVIFAADCVYFEPAFPLLEKTIDEAMGEEAVLWFCYLKRRKRDAEMVKRLEKIGLVVREVDTGESGRRYGRKAGYGVGPGEGRGKGGVVLFEVRRGRDGGKRLEDTGLPNQH